jgi:hypothetical protein
LANSRLNSFVNVSPISPATRKPDSDCDPFFALPFPRAEIARSTTPHGQIHPGVDQQRKPKPQRENQRIQHEIRMGADPPSSRSLYRVDLRRAAILREEVGEGSVETRG